LVVKEPNLLLLDELLNHLDIPANEQFEQALTQCSGTVITATHDRSFIDNFATSVWWIGQSGQTSTLTKFLSRREFELRGMFSRKEKRLGARDIHDH
jgi:ATP-binding cassette subfamily F protein 3